MRWDKISNSGRSASNRNPDYDLREFYFTNRLVNAIEKGTND